MRNIFITLFLLCVVCNVTNAQPSFFDETFGYNGVVTTEVPEEGYGYKCILLPDGKILQAASIGTAYSRDAGIYRREHNGKIDSSFGNDGCTMFLTDEHILDLQLATYPDGRILFFRADFGSPGYKSFIYRMLPSGTVDSTFGENGKHTISDSNMSRIFVHMINKDGKIFAAGSEGGYVNNYAMTRPALWRLTSNGQPDTTFGTNGKIVIPLGRDSMIVLASCKDSNNGYVFFYRTVFEGSNEILALRVHEDGSIDPSFGRGGQLKLVLTDSYYDILTTMTLPDGSIVFAVNFGADPKSRTVIVKIKDDGELDPTFGSGGTVEVKTVLDVTYITSLALDSSDRIIASGRISTYFGTQTSSVFRVLPSGVVDSTFGTNGVLKLIDDYSGTAAHVLIQPDRKYLISGGSHSYEPGKYRIMMVRLNPEPKVFVKPNVLHPLGISLHPTPSTDNCTVTYTLPANGECTMSLRDESGREVRTLVTNEYRTAGEHKEELDLRGLAAGVYFLQIESGGNVQTAKLIKQ